DDGFRNGWTQDLDGESFFLAGGARRFDCDLAVFCLESARSRTAVLRRAGTRLGPRILPFLRGPLHAPGPLVCLRLWRDAPLLGLITSEGDVPLVLCLDQIALDLALDEVGDLPIADGREVDAIATAQETLLASKVGTVLRVLAEFVG